MLDALGELAGAVGHGEELDLLLVVEVLGHGVETGAEFLQLLGENVRHDVRLANAEGIRAATVRERARPLPHGRGSAAGGPDADGGEETLGCLADDLRLCRRVLGGNEGEQAAAAAWAEQLVEQVLDGAAADLQAEVIGGHVLQRVRLVEDDDLVVGQQVRSLAAQGEVAEEQGVVDDQQLAPKIRLRALK